MGIVEQRILAVGFVDLTHFSRLLEQVETEEVVRVLQERFEKAGDVLVAHGGRIRKYLGDAILFSFEDPARAAGAAREIAAIPPREVAGVLVRYQVAVATGAVVSTRIGHPSLVTEDLFGLPINRAARLLADAGRSESGYALCEETSRYA